MNLYGRFPIYYGIKSNGSKFYYTIIYSRNYLQRLKKDQYNTQRSISDIRRIIVNFDNPEKATTGFITITKGQLTFDTTKSKVTGIDEITGKYSKIITTQKLYYFLIEDFEVTYEDIKQNQEFEDKGWGFVKEVKTSFKNIMQHKKLDRIRSSQYFQYNNQKAINKMMKEDDKGIELPF